MGGGGKGGAPGPQFGQGPYSQAAQAQGDQSKVGLQGVVGGSGWSQGPGGQWTQTQGFNGPLAGAAQGYQQQIADQTPLDFGSLPGLDYGADTRKSAEDAAYGQATSRLDPQWAQAQEQQQAQLANSGLDSPSMEANQNQWGNFNRAKNDAYNSAQRNAVGQGLQAQQQAFTQSLGARQQGLAEILKQRGMPLEQLQGIMGLLGGAQSVGAAQVPNLLGAASAQGNFNLENQNMQNQASGQFWDLLGKVGGTAAQMAPFLSDERAKQKIERLPLEVVDGVPVAIFEYRHLPGRKFVGVIAQDVLKVLPHLVYKRSDGLLCVDYGGLH